MADRAGGDRTAIWNGPGGAIATSSMVRGSPKARQTAARMVRRFPGKLPVRPYGAAPVRKRQMRPHRVPPLAESPLARGELS